MNEAKMNELTQAEDMAYFRADLCCYSHAEPLRGSRARVSATQERQRRIARPKATAWKRGRRSSTT